MRAKDQDSDGADAQFIRLPAYPFKAQELLQVIRTRLEKEAGRAIGFEELGATMGVSTSTAHYWFSVYRHPHLIALMCLLERLSRYERQNFLREHLRLLPTISHPKLTESRRCLKAILGHKAGLTIITGASDRDRSFVITAIGNSCRCLPGIRIAVTGIDIHRPTHFVPVLGVQYIDERLKPSQIRQLALSVWPKLLTTNSQLVLLNKVWSAVPEITEELIRLAAVKHVVLAEASASAHAIPQRIAQLPSRIRRISSCGPGAKGIRIT